jgi:hypothetical protein
MLCLLCVFVYRGRELAIVVFKRATDLREDSGEAERSHHHPGILLGFTLLSLTKVPRLVPVAGAQFSYIVASRPSPRHWLCRTREQKGHFPRRTALPNTT